MSVASTSATHRSLGGGHSLPQNPSYLEFPRSDGDRNQWPSNIQRVIDHEGHVNFMRPVPLDESIAIGWRRNMGAAIARQLNLPEGQDYILKDWPEGYQMYDHNKGPKDNPRHDPYLVGSVHVKRFRSVPEFVPHAVWLMQDPTMDRYNCTCKYCAKRSQRSITETLGLSQKSRSTPIPSHSPTSTRSVRPLRAPRERERDRPHHTYHPNRPYIAVRRAPKPVRTSPGPKNAMVRERAHHLRAIYSSAGMKSRRWYREGEVVWCALQSPIAGPTPDSSILFWPAIVEDMKIKSIAIPREAPLQPPTNATVDSISDNMNGASSDLRGTAENQPNPTDDGNAQLPWKVEQWTVYKMKLLGSSVTFIISEDKVLPYQGYRVPQELEEAVRFFALETPNLTPESINDFNPCPTMTLTDENGATITVPKEVALSEAAAPYSLATKIAFALASYWTPTDEWEYKATASPHNNAASISSNGHPTSFNGTRNAGPSSASRHNHASPSKAFSNMSISNGSAAVSGSPGLSESDLHTLSNRMLGVAPQGEASQGSGPSITFTQKRYQGLWWGAERIWVDELVRLKIARSQIAPDGTERIAAPSPGKPIPDASSEELIDMDWDPRSGAAGYGLFMRLTGLFVVDVRYEDGSSKRECRASGTLYELASEEWTKHEENQQQQVTNPKDKGKGKAREEIHADEDFNLARAIEQSLSQSAPTEDQAGPSFMPGPSPLKPPPLPNPDPSVPVQDTASSVFQQSLPDTNASSSLPESKPSSSPNTQLSRPVLSTSYPLPAAPMGTAFRPIMSEDDEIVISLSLISGRYYPGILTHELLQPILSKPLLAMTEKYAGLGFESYFSLEGIAPGYYNAVDPSRWKSSRVTMMREADAEARKDLWEQWQAWQAERGEVPVEED